MNGTRNSPIVSSGAGRFSCARSHCTKILVVDNESVIADTIAKILSLSGYEAKAAYDGDEALDIALLSPPGLLITDVVLPRMNGIELAITINRVYPDCKVLLFSGQATAGSLLAAASRAGHNFTLLNKPLPPLELLAMVKDRLTANSAGLRADYQ
jgi:CheY-like chemotaxis protein